MAAKQKVKSRNWTNEETCLFVEILVDAEYSFAACIEKRSPKRSANEEVYEDILKIFNSKLREAHFVEVNKNNFGKSPYEHLQIDTKKLQIKYNFLKKKWREIKDRPRLGLGLAPQELPAWYSDLDLVLGDTNTGLEDVVSEPAETSYGQNVLENENENESTDEELEEKVLNDNSELTQSQESIIRKKIVVKPHQKRKAIRSQTQALSHQAGGMA